MKQIVPLDPATYRRHAIHGDNRTWAETNCYSDVIIELLHGLGHEPIAALPFTLAIDFEGDQWTFFKFPDSDLYELYGLDIHELNPWRTLVQHIGTEDHWFSLHPVDLTAGSRLSKAIGSDRPERCHSVHHQSVGALGRGLTTAAAAPFSATSDEHHQADSEELLHRHSPIK